jgi:hypothetical protein
MDIFGDNWIGHEEKIKSSWMLKVKEDDIVVLPGDFSWSMYLEDTVKDFEFLNNLPGKKILLKGNHDYWWSTVTSMRKFLKENNFENIDFLYNNAYEFENFILVGTRGWNMSDYESDFKIINRELQRLELSINDGISKFGNDKEIIVFMHYPPITSNKLMKHEELQFVNIMKKHNVKRCYYGHLHSASIKDAVQGNVEGIEFKLVSADGLNFELLKIN